MDSTNKKRVVIVGIAFFLFASVLLAMELWRSDPGFRWWISQLTGTIDDNETSIFSGKTKNEERATAINPKAMPGSPGASRNFSDAPRQSSERLAAIPPKPDGPFPFQRNCKAMQSYFNTSVNWSESVTFEGFEKYESTQLQNYLATFGTTSYYPNTIQCFGGYWTKVTPVRKTVCRGSIVYIANENKPKYWAGKVGFPSSDNRVNAKDCSFDPPYYP